jgi:hypothetical protein
LDYSLSDSRNLDTDNIPQRFREEKRSIAKLDIPNEGIDIDPIDQKTIDLKLNSDGLESKNDRAGSLARLDSTILEISPATPPFSLKLSLRLRGF